MDMKDKSGSGSGSGSGADPYSTKTKDILKTQFNSQLVMAGSFDQPESRRIVLVF